jgi:PST family polysaccharide transporter
VFGEQWQPAAAPLQVLSLGGMIFVVRMLMGPMAQAKGRADLVLLWSLITFGLQGAAFFVGVQFGIVGVAFAYLIVQAVTTPPNVAHFGRFIGMKLSDYLAALVPATSGALVMAATWEGVSTLVERTVEAPTVARLLAATAVALLAYVATIRALWPAKFAAARGMLGTMTSRG